VARPGGGRGEGEGEGDTNVFENVGVEMVSWVGCQSRCVVCALAISPIQCNSKNENFVEIMSN